ncbi:MAG: non-heme iron oxygenase ferredoxin subunit [Acidimicrobiales bacterium]
MSGKTIRLCALDDIAPQAARRFDVEDRRLALIRLGDEVFVIGDRCTHADVSLAEGEIDSDARTIECWRHGAVFSIETGEPQSLPATKPVPTYRVSVVDGDVMVTIK